LLEFVLQEPIGQCPRTTPLGASEKISQWDWNSGYENEFEDEVEDALLVFDVYHLTTILSQHHDIRHQTSEGWLCCSGFSIFSGLVANSADFEPRIQGSDELTFFESPMPISVFMNRH
jgi:hypothetical protein